MTHYPTLAAHAAARLGVHRTTLTSAIQAGRCAGEERDGRWYTSAEAAQTWYDTHYRHRASRAAASGSAWTPDEEETLCQLMREGRPAEEIAEAMDREPRAVQVKASRLRSQGRLPPPHAAPKPTPADPYKARRQAERDGRLRLHVPPKARCLIEQAVPTGMRLSSWMTYAALAAIADPTIIDRGLREAARRGIKSLSSAKGVD